jgi:P27 family predicted phage terminase small subunit
VTPQPPSGLLKVTKQRWQTYWGSELARATREAHLPMVERLFQRYDERERAYRTVRKDGRVTIGSTGQMVAHPLLRYIDNCDSEIRQLEDRLGLSPRGMAQLGSSFATAARSLDDLNHALETDDDDSDPRVEAVS